MTRFKENNMKTYIGMMIIAMVMWSGLAGADDFSMWAQSMSADQVMTANGKTMTSKIFVDHGKVRTEIKAGGMDMISIMRPDKKMIYSVMPAQKMVMEMPITSASMQEPGVFSDAQRKFVADGEETINGIACDRYTYTDEKNHVMRMWVDHAKRMPVLMKSDDGAMKIEWKNVVMGPQSASLFEPPAGYQRMSMPTGKMPPMGR